MSASPTLGERGRLNPVVRVGFYLPAMALVSTGLVILTAVLWQVVAVGLGLPPMLLLDGSATSVPDGLSHGAFVVGIVLVTYLFRRFVDRQAFASLGFRRERGWIEEGVLGFGLGAVLMTLILLAELALGGYRLRAVVWQEQPLGTTLALLGIMFAGFVVVAFNEELITRGYILQNLALAWGIPLAVAVSSAVFSVAHLLNPGAGPISTAGLFFAGLLLAGGYVATKRLWFSMGLHLSWNFFQGPIFGFAVSGLATGSVLILDRTGPDVLTGGPFGPEASVAGIGANLLGLLLLWRWRRRAAGVESCDDTISHDVR